MAFAIITISFNPVTKSFHPDELNRFCLNKKILMKKVSSLKTVKRFIGVYSSNMRRFWRSSIYSINEIARAIGQIDNNATITAISGLLSLLNRQIKTCVGFPEPYTPEQVRGVIPDLARYNTLVKGGKKV